MDPATQALVGEVVKPLVQPVMNTIMSRAAKYLTDSESQAVQKHLAEAIREPEKLPSWFHFRERLEVERNISDVGRAVQESTPEPGMYAGLAHGMAGADLRDSWRDEVSRRLSEVAILATQHSTSNAWKQALGGRQPDAWANAVTFAFENRLRADERLRFLVQTLDYRQDQAGRVVVAIAVQDMAKSMRRVAAAISAIAAVIVGLAEALPHFLH